MVIWQQTLSGSGGPPRGIFLNKINPGEHLTFIPAQVQLVVHSPLTSPFRSTPRYFCTSCWKSLELARIWELVPAGQLSLNRSVYSFYQKDYFALWSEPKFTLPVPLSPAQLARTCPLSLQLNLPSPFDFPLPNRLARVFSPCLGLSLARLTETCN